MFFIVDKNKGKESLSDDSSSIPIYQRNSKIPCSDSNTNNNGRNIGDGGEKSATGVSRISPVKQQTSLQSSIKRLVPTIASLSMKQTLNEYTVDNIRRNIQPNVVSSNSKIRDTDKRLNESNNRTESHIPVSVNSPRLRTSSSRLEPIPNETGSSTSNRSVSLGSNKVINLNINGFELSL